MLNQGQTSRAMKSEHRETARADTTMMREQVEETRPEVSMCRVAAHERIGKGNLGTARSPGWTVGGEPCETLAAVIGEEKFCGYR